MSYYDDQESVANIYVGLVERGWKCYGYKADESDSMTDYFSPARWGGIATKDGFVLLVDVYSTSDSGRKVTKQGYHVDYNKIQKLTSLMNDKAATEGEKESCRIQLEKLYKKENESIEVVEEWPVYSFANPKKCNWHIEKDGVIIAKGNGAYKCGGYLFGGYEENTMEKVNVFIDRIEKFIKGNEQLKKVIKKEVKKVIKPVEVTDRTDVRVGDVLSFDYHGHFWEVTNVNEKTFSYELLGVASRGYQRTRNGKRYYDYLNRFNKNLAEGKVKIHVLKEIDEVKEVVTYKKETRKQQPQHENLVTGETATEQPKQDQNTKQEGRTTYKTGTGSKGNGIEIYFTDKPNKETRELIKANGYRWGGNNRPNVWWAVETSERLEVAKSICVVSVEGNGQKGEAEQQTQQTNENPYNNEVKETPSGYYCHFKSWNLECEDIAKLLNEFNIPFDEACEKFIFNGVSERDLVLIQTINKENGSILFDDNYRHEEEIQKAYNSEPEKEQEENSNVIDFVSKLNNENIEAETMNIFDKFDQVEIQNDNRISEHDKIICESWEASYKDTLEAYKKVLEVYRGLKDNNNKNYSLIKYGLLEDVEKDIKSLKNDFIGKICTHFKSEYNISIESGEIKQKYDESVTYENILDEIFIQLDGLDFNEKAVNEIKEKSSNAVRYEKIKISNNKVTLSDYIWWDSYSWDGTRLGWSDSKLNPLFIALSHFETNHTEMMNTFKNIYEQFQKGIKYHDILSKYNLTYLNKIKGLRAYKNGRIDIEFSSHETALKFVNGYLKASKAA